MANTVTLGTNLPASTIGIIADNTKGGILAQLCPEKPTLFGAVTGVTFTSLPKAQVVGEGEAKSSNGGTAVPFRAEPIKIQVSQRVSSEFVWGSEDYQLATLEEQFAPMLGKAITRGVDLLAFHGVNPATGELTTKMPTYINKTTKRVEAAGKPTAELVQAIGLVDEVSGIAINNGFSWSLATDINPTTGAEMNPGFGFSDALNFKGVTAAKGSTVSGNPEITDTKARAFVGDWSQVRWGFQREIPLEVIEYGDPDNTGRDLKGHNEALLRVEAVVYIAVGDVEAFAAVEDKA